MSHKNPYKRVFPIEIQKDEYGRFVPFCNYHIHQGVIKPNAYQTCEQRKCTHLIKLRFLPLGIEDKV